MERSRIVAIAALVVGLAVVSVILLGGGGDSYQVTVRFPEAGQMVKGGQVEVGGRPVGKIKELKLGDDGVAEVVMNLTDDEVKPLKDCTRAEIRAVGLVSVTNRFVELRPCATGRDIPDGGVLPLNQTKGIVDLDQLLDTFTEKTRGRLQTVIAEFAKGLQQPTTGQLNKALYYFDPALYQTTALGQELTLDQHALEQLVTTAATTVHALARRPDALRSAIAQTSQTLGQVADHRAAFADTLDRAPAVFNQTTRTLRSLQNTLPDVNPVLRGLRPAAPQLAGLLRELPPIIDDALPTFTAVQKLLPKARAALAPIPELAKEAVPAFGEALQVLKEAAPIASSLRPYVPDLLAGFFQGFTGTTGGYYDANGHFSRISFNFGSVGIPGLIPAQPGGLTSGKVQYGLTSRCPGAAAEPAADGSNPFPGLPKDVCDEGQNPK
jgi:phospholipid/cholesterol/gamma-HCH transport system substrate-binding protein